MGLVLEEDEAKDDEPRLNRVELDALTLTLGAGLIAAVKRRSSWERVNEVVRTFPRLDRGIVVLALLLMEPLVRTRLNDLPSLTPPTGVGGGPMPFVEREFRALPNENVVRASL